VDKLEIYNHIFKK